MYGVSYEHTLDMGVSLAVQVHSTAEMQYSYKRERMDMGSLNAPYTKANHRLRRGQPTGEELQDDSVMKEFERRPYPNDKSSKIHCN